VTGNEIIAFFTGVLLTNVTWVALRLVTQRAKRVYQWTDLSGNRNDLVQGSPENQPRKK
jgi:hypothetical protein